MRWAITSGMSWGAVVLVLLVVMAAAAMTWRRHRERRHQARADALWRAYSERGLL